MHKFKNITTKIIGVALATTLAVGGVTVMAASGGSISCGSTTKVNIGKTNNTISTDYVFVPEHTGTYHLESSNIVLTGGYGVIDPMVRVIEGTTVTSDYEICRFDDGVEGTRDFAGDVELVEGQTYTFRVSSHFNPNLRPTGNFDFTLSVVDIEEEEEEETMDPAYQYFATEAEYLKLAENLHIVDLYMAQYQMLLSQEELDECFGIMCMAREALYTPGLTSWDIEFINGRLFGIVICIDMHREAVEEVAPEDVAPDYGMPEETPDVDPNGGDETQEDVAPDYGMPDETPDVDPNGGDETPEDVAPDYGMPDETPDVDSNGGDETPGDVTPDETPDVIPDRTPDVTPDQPGEDEGETVVEITVEDDTIPADESSDETSEDVIEVVVPETVVTVTEAPVVAPVSSSSSSVSSAPASAPVTQVAGATRNGVEGFVDRLYEDALNRNADAAGRLYWINLLNTKAKSGTEVANGFLNSVEFMSRDLDNEEFVNTLYSVFFNRKPDSAGLRNWMNALENGAARSEIISGFTSSEEWNSMCAQFGINA